MVFLGEDVCVEGVWLDIVGVSVASIFGFETRMNMKRFSKEVMNFCKMLMLVSMVIDVFLLVMMVDVLNLMSFFVFVVY